MISTIFNIKFFLLSCAYLTSIVSAKTLCPITPTYGRFEFSCEFTGSFTNKSIINKIKNVPLVSDCATHCLANKHCLLFSFNSYLNEPGTCTLFNKDKTEMGYKKRPIQQFTSFYERECFSTNCDVIQACNSFTDCPYSYNEVDLYYEYKEFGCGYGVDTLFPADIKYGNVVKQIFLPDAKQVCDAITLCSPSATYGNFVVAYYKPENQWLCTTYKNACRSDKDCAGYTKYYNQFTEYTEYLTRTTFTHKNSSIGQTVAFWQYGSYY